MNKAIRDAIKAEEEKAYQKGFADGLQIGGFDFDTDSKLTNENVFSFVTTQALSYMRFRCHEGLQYEMGMLAVLKMMRIAFEELREMDKRVKEIHTDEGCESCKFEDKAIGEEPCKNCKRSYMDEWEAKR